MGLATALALATASMAGAAGSNGSLAVTLAPIAAPAAPTRVGTVGVTLRFDGVTANKGEPLLRLPMVSSNVDTVATVIAGISARDARGPLRLTSRDVDLPEAGMRDAVGGGPSREWLADRAVEGPLTVRYSVPAEASLPPRGPAPPFAFSADGGGVSAAGHVFLLLPPGDHHYRTTYGWDLARAPRGSRGVSSLGEGTVTAAEPLDGAQLRMSFFMAGRIGTYPPRLPSGGFFGAWQGDPGFDAAALLAWTGTLYDHYARFFGQKESPPYGVFLRYNPINAGGGVGLYHAFVTTFGKGHGSDVGRIRLTLAHEMFHTFQPFIATPAGLDPPGSERGWRPSTRRASPSASACCRPRPISPTSTGRPRATIPARWRPCRTARCRSASGPIRGCGRCPMIAACSISSRSTTRCAGRRAAGNRSTT
ncbi:hypothetical protein ACFSTI_12215 [Rhizorhabdus histidinilytica]